MPWLILQRRDTDNPGEGPVLRHTHRDDDGSDVPDRIVLDPLSAIFLMSVE